MEEIHGVSSSNSSLNRNNVFKLNINYLESSPVSQAEEFMKDFSNPSNLIKFKQLIEDSEIKLPERILIQALELLSDASSFKYHSENTIIHFEIQLRTWMATLERVCYSSIILGCEIREQLYKNLSNFVNFHYKTKTVFKKGVSDSFKSNAKSKGIINNDVYMHFQNYNIDFLLVHLRDTLHSMRDDETRTDETLRRIRDFLLAFIHISPKAASTASGNITNILGIAESLPNFAKALNCKYPIIYWYPTWRELLLIHYSLENLAKDDIYSTLRFYNETYLLELLWQYVFDLSINQITPKEILNSQNEILEFLNLWTKKEPTAPPNSLWYGVLDLAQNLSQKTSQLVSLALCYYLGLEALQKSKCNYICFKSLELLLSLSYKKPELFENIIQDEINKYKELLPITSQQVFEKLIHDVTQKLQLNVQFMKQLSLTNTKERSEIKGDKKLILDIIADELTCPITRQITGDFLILTCGHSISNDAINKWKEATIIENRLFVCPICKNEIKLNSIYNLPKNKILKGIYEKLEQAGYFDKSLEERQISSNKIYMVEDDLFLKFNKFKIFQNSMFSKVSTPIFQKVQPRVMLPAFNKAAKAEQQEDYEAVIMWLTQVIQLYPKNYSIRCRRAFASHKLKMYSKAKEDLDTAIQLKPSKSLAYIYRSHIFIDIDRYEESLADLNKSLKIEPNNVVALRGRGITYFKMSRYEESLADLNKSLKIEPDNAVALNYRGKIYCIINKYGESLADLNKSLEIEPNNAVALRNRATTYFKLSRYEESLIDLNKSLEIEPNNAVALRDRGSTYSMMSKYKESLIDLNKSLDIEPNNAVALRDRGTTYSMMSKYEESLADFNKYLEIEPNNAVALRDRGTTYFRMSRFEESLADFNKSLEIDPNNTIALDYRNAIYRLAELNLLEIEPKNAVALRDRGTTYFKMSKYAESLVDFNKSLIIEPNNAAALRYRGIACFKMSIFNGLLADFNESLKIEPNNAVALNYRGKIYYMINRYEKSLADLNKSLKIEQNNAEALRDRGKTYFKMGRYEESLADFNKSLEIEPNNAGALKSRAKTYHKMGRYGESLTDLNQTLLVEPNNAFTLSYRGAVYREMNRYEESLADLIKSLDIEPNNAFALSNHEKLTAK